METTNYGHLSRQLKEVLSRMTGSRSAFAFPSDVIVIESVIPKINRLERIHNALESIGVNLDEEDIVALEWIASTHDMTDKDESWTRFSMREALAGHINDYIRSQQEQSREREQKRAIEALAKAGFVLNDEDGETWTKGGVTVKIELTNGRESRYKWEYENGDPVTMSLYCEASGMSGDFHRLLALIGTEVKS